MRTGHAHHTRKLPQVVKDMTVIVQMIRRLEDRHDLRAHLTVWQFGHVSGGRVAAVVQTDVVA